MNSVLWKATPGQLTRDLPITHPFRARLLGILPDMIVIQLLRQRRPAPLLMRLHGPLLLCPLLLCQAFPRSTKLLRYVPRNRRPRRVFPRATSSLRKQAPKSSPFPTISRHRFARANQHRHLQPQKYVRQKYQPNMTMRSVAASQKRLSRKVSRLWNLSRLHE
jgi:hypothetical protein